MGPFKRRRHGTRARLGIGLSVLFGCGMTGGQELVAAPMTLQRPPGGAATDSAPLDLAGERDPNGLLLNPKWGVQRDGRALLPKPDFFCDFRVATNWLGNRHLQLRHSPPCVSQPHTLHEPLEPKYAGVACNGGEEVGLPQGHINWFPATYTGPIIWGGYAADRDYDLFLSTVGKAGQTWGNAELPGLELEFDAREIVDRVAIPANTVWSRFVDAAKRDSTGVLATPLDSLMNGKYAIATGLLGLDGIHDYHAELHPVWALAIEVDATPIHAVWMIFVRNLGNEGECGAGQLPLLRNTAGDTALSYAFALPWKPGASSVTPLWGPGTSLFVSENPQVNGPRLRADSGKALYVTFRLPKVTQAADYALVYGELHLRWPGAVSGAPILSIDSVAKLIKLRQIESWTPRERRDVTELKARASGRNDSGTTPTVAQVPESLIPPHDMELSSWGPLPTTEPFDPVEVPVFYRGDDSAKAVQRHLAEQLCRDPQDELLKAQCRPLAPPRTSPYLAVGHATTIAARQSPHFDLRLAAGIRIPAGELRLPLPLEQRAAAFANYRGGKFEERGVEASLLHCVQLCGYKLQSLVAVGAEWTMGPDTARAFRFRVPDVVLRARVPLVASFVDRLTVGLRASLLWPKGRGLFMAYLDGVLWR